MSAKILINGPAGTGKTSLLKPLRKTFVVSRDGKAFPFPMAHMVIKEYLGMSTILYGGDIEVDGEETHIEGVLEKIEKYNDKFGEYPETVAIDSVSKLMLDAIDYANLNFEGFDVHSTINKEMATLTSFIQETLVANGVNVVLINHVMENDKKGYIPIGQGKFKDKGGFYSEVDYSLFIEGGKYPKVTHRGSDKQARTLIEGMPTTQYVRNIIDDSKSKKLGEDESFFDLQEYIDIIATAATEIADEWEF